MTENEVESLLRVNMLLTEVDVSMYTPEDMKLLTAVWHYHFRDYPYSTVKAAFMEAHKNHRYTKCLIQPADIFEQLNKLKPSPETEWQAVLEAVNKAQRYIGWRACPMIVGQDDDGKPIRSHGEAELTEVYNSLPESGKAYLGGVSGLVDLARLGDTDLQFRRNEFLRVAREQPTTPAMLPGAVKAQIGGSHE